MMKQTPYSGKSPGFTLVEMLVSVAVLTILVVVLTSLISGLRLAIAGTTNQIAQFQEARDAFETMTRRIGQATLNAYDDADPHMMTTGTSNGYLRASELRFISGNAADLILTTPGISVTGSSGPTIYPTNAIFFQAPLGYTLASGTSANYAGLNNLLNTCGYFLQWNSDQSIRPGFLSKAANPIALRWRLRLMELVEPSDYLNIYSHTSQYSSGASSSWYYTTREWYQTPLTATYQTPAGTVGPPVHAIAENVVFLCLLPMVAPQNAQTPTGGAPDGTSTDIAPGYKYDSSPVQGNSLVGLTPPVTQNLLPPMVYVMMIAVDEKSFSRYELGRTDPTADPTGDLGIANAQANLTDPSFLTNATYQNRVTDINNVTASLTKHNISYRIFTAAVPLTPN